MTRTPPFAVRAKWWIQDYFAASAVLVRSTLCPGDGHRYESGTGSPCVLVPGVYETWHFLRPVAEALHDAGHPVFVLPELRHNSAPVLDGARLLAQFVQSRGLTHVTIAAHSKGGLIGKYAMLQFDPESRLDRLVTIATPFSGSRYAQWAPGRTLRAFRSDDPVTRLLSAERAVNRRITSIFPAFDPIVPEGSWLTDATNIRIPVAGHFRVLTHPKTLRAVVNAAREPEVK